MKDYVKTVLYVYPLLETVEKDYEEHILNRAVLSYRSQRATEDTVEYLAAEILEKRNWIWLKAQVDKVLNALSDVERTLLAIRYFGKTRSIKRATVAKDAEKQTAQRRVGIWSESTYFRIQSRLLKKVGEMLARLGVDAQTFEETFSHTDVYKRVVAMQKRKENAVSQNERDWLRA